MGEIALGESYSLDRVIQAPGGPDEDRRGGFEHGGWANDYDFNYGEGVGLEQAQNAEALLLGRVTDLCTRRIERLTIQRIAIRLRRARR